MKRRVEGKAIATDLSMTGRSQFGSSIPNEMAGDWYLKLRGRLRSGEIKTKRTFAKSWHKCNGVDSHFALKSSPSVRSSIILVGWERQVCPEAPTQDQGISRNPDHEGLLGKVPCGKRRRRLTRIGRVCCAISFSNSC